VREASDAELAALIAPRKLIVEFAKAPETPALTGDELSRINHLYAANFGLEPEELKFKGTMELTRETAVA
jgi:hypothetical protein